jgi:hypothetical protein
MRRVDNFIGKEWGVTHRDIADWQWYDAYESEMSPRAAAEEAMTYELEGFAL